MTPVMNQVIQPGVTPIVNNVIQPVIAPVVNNVIQPVVNPVGSVVSVIAPATQRSLMPDVFTTMAQTTILPRMYGRG